MMNKCAESEGENRVCWCYRVIEGLVTKEVLQAIQEEMLTSIHMEIGDKVSLECIYQDS